MCRVADRRAVRRSGPPGRTVRQSEPGGDRAAAGTRLRAVAASFGRNPDRPRCSARRRSARASGSRGGLLGLLALGLAWGHPRLRGAGAAAAVIVALSRRSCSRCPRHRPRPSPLRAPAHLAAAAGAALAELPLGAGPSGFVDAVLPHNFPRDGEAARYHRIPALAESDVLQLATTLGLPGVACAWAGAGGRAAPARRTRLRRGGGARRDLGGQHAADRPTVAWVATLAVARCCRARAAGRCGSRRC